MRNQACNRNVILWLLALALAVPVAAQDVPPEIQRLRSLIDRATDEIEPMDEIPAIAIDAGPAAIPLLSETLARDKGHRATLAAVGLAYIGGEAAVDALLQHYKVTKDPRMKALIATAMGSTKLTAANRAFLEDCLQGEHFGTAWMPIVSAAFSLGVLRASESREALEATVKKSSGSIAAGAAREALRWISQGNWNVDIAPTADVEPPIIAILRNGIPRTDEVERYFDSDRSFYWVRKGNTWTVEKKSDERDTPSMSFRLHLSPDGARALVSVGITFGPLNGSGYDYVLRKVDKDWVVQSVFFTWIS